MNSPHKVFSLRAVVQMLFFVVAVPFLPLLISRRWDWWEAWTYGILCVLGFALSRMLAARRHPDLLAERARFTQHEPTTLCRRASFRRQMSRYRSQHLRS